MAGNGLVEVNHNQLKLHLLSCYKAKLPLFIWGTTGIGKSETIKQVTKELGIDLIDVRISQLDPSDLRGLPKYVDGGETTKWLPPDWLPKSGKGILLLDELNLAAPSIQASGYQLILDRRIGGYVLPEGWVVVGAGNRIEDRANVFTMAGPLRDRLLQVTLRKPSVEEWSEWALENGVNKDIVAFLSWKPSYLHTFEKDKDASVFSTPRSWVFASILINNAEKGIDEKQLVSSAIGQGIAIEFTAFRKLNQKVDLNKLLKNPESVKAITEIDMKYILVSALSSKYETSRKELQNIMAVSNFMDAEFGILLARMLRKGNKYFKSDFQKLVRTENKIVTEWINKNYKFLKDEDLD